MIYYFWKYFYYLWALPQLKNGQQFVLAVLFSELHFFFRVNHLTFSCKQMNAFEVNSIRLNQTMDTKILTEMEQQLWSRNLQVWVFREHWNREPIHNILHSTPMKSDYWGCLPWAKWNKWCERRNSGLVAAIFIFSKWTYSKIQPNPPFLKMQTIYTNDIYVIKSGRCFLFSTHLQNLGMLKSAMMNWINWSLWRSLEAMR